LKYRTGWIALSDGWLVGSLTSPLAISAWVTLWAGSLALACALYLGWLLAKKQFPGKILLEVAVLLPLVLPPTVLGYYLLSALGQRGLGPWVELLAGLRFVFALPGAVVAAAVAALPLVVQAIRASLAGVEREIEEAGRIDGCSEWQLFWSVSLPIAWRGILAGAILGYLRALGDFGATLMVAGNIPGRTQTLSMAVYDAVQANDLSTANRYVVLLSLLVGVFLFFVTRLGKEKDPELEWG
jgi:molybdate transport system permease protein